MVADDTPGAAWDDPTSLTPGPGFDEGQDPAPDVAPAVVAVVVTHDSGPWLEGCLAALGAQDYPNLSVLVVDSGSSTDITGRVAAVLPSAYVRRLDTNVGFGPAASEVLAMVEGASHYLFCHDDVAPDGDAVRLMVEEAFRSNAGVVAPKLVSWDDPSRLLTVGLPVDKSGTPAVVVEPGELDQEQHDAVRDVFLAPGGCTLVRADLFASLGGFDPAITAFGEDLDLSWRTQIAGARVLVAPAARVRHVEAMAHGQRRPPSAASATAAATGATVERYIQRHRLRTVLVCYSLFNLLRVIPQILVLQAGELAYALSTGRRRQAVAIVRAWQWNLGRLGDLRAARRRLRAIRALPDRDVRRLQVRGSARISAFVRSRLGPGAETRLWDASRTRLTESVPAGRLGIAVWVTMAVVLLAGTRSLLFGGLPAIGDFAPFPESPFAFLRHFVSGWRTAGLGSESPAPAAFGLLGLSGMLLGGAMGALQKVLVLGGLPLGIIGVYRMARPFGSPRARLVAAVVYAAVPLPYGALARGSWAGLLAYGAMPWILHRLVVSTGLEPFAGRVSPAVPAGVRLGIGLALLGALAPTLPVVIVVTAALLAVAGLVAGPVRMTGAALPRAAIGGGVALVLLFPWSLDLVLPGGSGAGLLGVPRSGATALSFAEAVRFELGPVGHGVAGWAFLVAGALPLLVGRSWRLAWAGRFWMVAIGSWLAAWAGGRGWLLVPVPAPEVWLAPAAVAMAMAAALGLVAFQLDLPGYKFGWRQVASVAAAVAVVAATLPIFGGALDGRWDMGDRDFRGALSWMREQRAAGDFRVLWLGDPAALPLDGWAAGDGLAYATSRNGPPDALASWAPTQEGASGLLADAIGLARQEGTTRLGHLLAPMAVRYIAVATAVAPDRPRPAVPVPADLLPGLSAQIDLRLISDDAGLVVYENAAWLPARAALDDERLAAAGASGLAAASRAELAGAKPALPRERSPFRFEGTLPPGAIFHSETAGGGWQLEVEGETVRRQPAFGWATVYPDTGGDTGRLRYRTSPLRYVALAIEVALWFAAVRLARRRRVGGTHRAGGVLP